MMAAAAFFSRRSESLATTPTAKAENAARVAGGPGTSFCSAIFIEASTAKPIRLAVSIAIAILPFG